MRSYMLLLLLLLLYTVPEVTANINDCNVDILQYLWRIFNARLSKLACVWPFNVFFFLLLTLLDTRKDCAHRGNGERNDERNGDSRRGFRPYPCFRCAEVEGLLMGHNKTYFPVLLTCDGSTSIQEGVHRFIPRSIRRPVHHSPCVFWFWIPDSDGGNRRMIWSR